LAEVPHELSAQIGDGGEDATGDDVALDPGEPQFDLVEPGRVSRREVQPDTIKRRAMGKMRAVQVAQGGGALAQFEAKFRDCARNALRPLSNESVDAVLSRVQQLDRVADVRDLLAPFED